MPKLYSRIQCIFTQGQRIFLHKYKAELTQRRETMLKMGNINEIHDDWEGYIQWLRVYGLRSLKSYTHIWYEYDVRLQNDHFGYLNTVVKEENTLEVSSWPNGLRWKPSDWLA